MVEVLKQSEQEGEKERLRLAPSSYVAASVSNLKAVTKDNQVKGCHEICVRVLEF